MLPSPIGTRPTSLSQISTFTARDVHAELSNICIPVNHSRQNVRTSPNTDIHAMLLGMYAHGPRVGISTWTREFPGISSMLSGWNRRVDATLQLTSIQVNWNYAAQAHVDRYNTGLSYIVAFGDFSDGQLWIQDPEGEVIHTITEDESTHLTGPARLSLAR